MDIHNEILIRLKDTNNETNMLSAFYTTNPSEYLKMYYFCNKNNIPISLKDENIIGLIDDIEVGFGGHKNLSYIDVFIETWG